MGGEALIKYVVRLGACCPLLETGVSCNRKFLLKHRGSPSETRGKSHVIM
jgi:hypothetical protein